MQDPEAFDGIEGGNDSQTKYEKLAQWLHGMLDTAPSHTIQPAPISQAEPALIEEYGQQEFFHQTGQPSLHDPHLELAFEKDYHPRFYQQLPDFIMALLHNEHQAPIHYAPLLYHLAGCATCHAAYLELYDALRAAITPGETRPDIGQAAGNTPQRMLAHLCEAFISQAEAILLQARHDRQEDEQEEAKSVEAARSLLQLAIHESSRITQRSMRQQALQNLVHVATLFDGASSPAVNDPDIYAYTPAPFSAGGKRAIRRADTPTRSTKGTNTPQEHFVIPLHSRSLEGTVAQNGRTLELHLHGLDPKLHGKPVQVSVLLGSLIEPIHWVGGNPHAIHSSNTVDTSGAITIQLGDTELSLSNPEERNMIEAILLLLEVRAA